MASAWLTERELQLKSLPENLKRWLIEPKRLSHSLKQSLSNWHIEVLKEHFSILDHEEAKALNMSPGSEAWIREIIHADDTPIVYAQVSIPAQTFQSMEKQLGTLKNQPIGDTLLFNQAHVSRSAFSFCEINLNHPLYQNAFGQLAEPRLWARRSVFHWHHLPLLITEVFSSKLPTYPG